MDYANAVMARNIAGPGQRPYWDVLGTWEAARLEDHELRYLELTRLFYDNPGVSAELQAAIATARRVCGAYASAR